MLIPAQSSSSPTSTFTAKSRVSALYYFSTVVLLSFGVGMMLIGVLLVLSGWGEAGILFYSVMATGGGATACGVIIYYSPRVSRVSLDPTMRRITVRQGPLLYRKKKTMLAFDDLAQVEFSRGEREGFKTQSAQRIVPVFRVAVNGERPLFSDDDEILCRGLAERICAAARVPLRDKTGLESVTIDPDDLDLPIVERLLRDRGLDEPDPYPPSSLITVQRSPAQLDYQIRSRSGPMARSTTLVADGACISVKSGVLGMGRRRVVALEAVERLSADERIVKSTPTSVQKQCLFRIVSDEQVIDIPTSSRVEAEWLRDRFGFDLVDMLTAASHQSEIRKHSGIV
ncbi:MAG: hypothetical protein OEM82_11850 [Acidobacteriota bacterium]|nr:hypothetical protein [Acidobacteriota bacterium]